MKTDRSEREHRSPLGGNSGIVGPPLPEQLGFRVVASKMGLPTKGVKSKFWP